ncbi:Hypothetical protein SMAX5B_017132 [Scophthalmus maximus]|uniref:Uncharacterized protein n=1 Tax=Scophthalmus maximus TaxID=52904 RepID=A0A2U9CKA7_SCOMX|nr:Hypothetical protein SMAX5B_017132 [Scophthalmus maximus]
MGMAKCSPDPPQNCSEKVGEILVRVMDLQKGTDMKQLFGAEVEVRHVHVANSTSKLKLLLYEDQVQQLQAGYIMSFDLHARCESCLGPEHAGVALTPRATCSYCARLPLAEKQRRADAFTAMQEVDDGDNDDSWAKRASFTVDEALEILDPSCRQAEGDGGQESSDSAPSISGSPPGSPIPRLGNAEPRSEATASGSAQLAGHVPALAALIRDLPDIISRAAGRKEIPLPLEPPAPAPSAMVVDMYSNQAVAKSLPSSGEHWSLLASSLSSIGAQPGALPSELTDEIGKIAATTLTLSSALAMTQSRIMAWMTMIQRNLWLNMSQLPEQMRKGLLQALWAFSKQGADAPPGNTSWVRAAPQALGFQASWQGRRGHREQRSRRGHPRLRLKLRLWPLHSAALLPSTILWRSQPAPPPRRAGRKNRRPVGTWANLPQEPQTEAPLTGRGDHVHG